MTMVEKILEFANKNGSIPVAGGAYHVLCVSAVLIVSFLVCVRLKNCGDKVFRRCVFVMWLSIFLFEIYKQVIFNIHDISGGYVFRYNWADLPFQLCSTPLYVLPFLAFLSDRPIRDFAASYTMTFTLIAGVAVYLIPSTVFSSNVILNIHTMLHHGMQIVSGVFVAIWYRKRICFEFYLKGVSVFVIMLAIAVFLNTAFYEYLIETKIISASEEFNMFYISPYQEHVMPVFRDFFAKLSPEDRPRIYFIGLSFAAAVTMLCVKSLSYLGKIFDNIDHKCY